MRRWFNRLARLNAGLLGRESVGFGASTVVEQGARVATALVVAALLGPEQWGRWFVLNLLLAYGSLAHFGALNGLNRDLPSERGAGREVEGDALERVALGVVGSSFVVVAIVAAVVYALVPSAISGPDVASLLLLFASHQAYGFAATSLRARARFADASRLQIASSVLHPALSIGGTALLGLPGYLLGQAIAYAGACLVAGAAGLVRFRPAFDVDRARRLVATGFPIMIVGVTYTVFLTVDRWVVVGTMGTEALGHYSLAIMAMSAVGLLPQALSQQVYPRMAFAWAARRDVADLRRMAVDQRDATIVVVLPILVAAAITVPLVVARFLPAYAPGIPAIVIMMGAPLIMTVGQGYGAILHVLGRQSWYLAIIVLATAGNVALSVVLVRSFGLAGVATATVIAAAAISGLRVLAGSWALRLARSDGDGERGDAG